MCWHERISVKWPPLQQLHLVSHISYAVIIIWKRNHVHKCQIFRAIVATVTEFAHGSHHQSINHSWSPFQWKETQCFRILRQVSVQPLSILWCWGKRRDLFSTVFRMNPSPASIFQHVFSRPRERGQRTCGFSLSFFFFWLKFLFLIPIDLENELMVTGGKGGKDRLGVWDWHVHTAICKITNKGLLHSTGNSA